MAKVLKPGKKWWVGVTLTCERCDCEFVTEVFDAFEFQGTDWAETRCPVCSCTIGFPSGRYNAEDEAS